MKTEDSDLTTVATFGSAVEASLAQQMLTAEGIEAYVHDNAMATAMWHLGVAIGGVKVQVPTKDAARALEIVEEARSGALVDDGDGFEDEEVNEDERESEADANATSQDEAALRILKAAVFGLLFPPLMFYAGWLLLQPMQSFGPLSDRNRRRLVVAGLLVAIALGWYLFFASVFVRNLRDPPLSSAVPYGEIDF